MNKSWQRDLLIAAGIVAFLLFGIHSLNGWYAHEATSHSISAMPLSENIEDRRGSWGWCEPTATGLACMEIILRK